MRKFLWDVYFAEGKDFVGFIFADHQVEYIVSLIKPLLLFEDQILYTTNSEI